ncbi:MAG: hypothetical protein HPM95_03870 [Alphaproteobacteria bacterium]|nr:hypothetical protein [Alphaproteobacteria bacterium]
MRRLDRKRIYARRIAYNLAKLAPGGPLDGRALAELDARWWRSAGMTKGEYSGVERYRTAGRVTLEGYETLTRMGLDKGQFIYVSVHLGSFDVLGEFVNNGLKRSCIGIWEPERNRFVNRLLSRLAGATACMSSHLASGPRGISAAVSSTMARISCASSTRCATARAICRPSAARCRSAATP